MCQNNICRRVDLILQVIFNHALLVITFHSLIFLITNIRSLNIIKCTSPDKMYMDLYRYNVLYIYIYNIICAIKRKIYIYISCMNTYHWELEGLELEVELGNWGLERKIIRCTYKTYFEFHRVLTSIDSFFF